MPRLFQSNWNGVDLEAIAMLPGTLEAGAPGPRFYAEYYRRLAAAGGAGGTDWERDKLANSEALRGWLDQLARQLGRDAAQLNVISVGAGLGVVEQPLLLQGYNITLHEIQEESLDQARRRFAVARHELRTAVGPLAEITERFDVAYLGTCEYCLTSDKAHEEFLQSVRDVLVPGGSIIAMDVAPSWRMVTHDLLDRVGLHRGILWGEARSARRRDAAMTRAGFQVKRIEYHRPGFRSPLAVSKKPMLRSPRGTATVTIVGRRV
jgi:SAM-dependent methyltransferase